ncbi:hypothetical protein HGRIS_001936 [Hohenbuehelia grisea]|uniref:Peptidase M43 pregnancy-associated plasma-A domain-containing protein n=1 Tax=Hohenbuehelia grisea TaxID=104357 RepID=A0ABR3JJK9_9AGAR
MFSILAVTLYVASSFVAGSPLTGLSTGRCGTYISPEKINAAEKHFAANKVSFSGSKKADTKINVHFHIIQKDDTREGGNIPDSDLEKQVEILNQDYANTTFSFAFSSSSNINRTTNVEWFTSAGPDSKEQTDMKTSLRQGGPTDLNVFTVGFEKGVYEGLLGYAVFPSDYKDAPEDDGIVVLHTTIPGGSMSSYNNGRTLTHEVGHWVGLYHTFQEGCSGEGDRVDDTPAQARATSGCPKEAVDTCPEDEGDDPVHNFMDYASDDCMNHFTDGQIKRMSEQMNTYRGTEL